VRRDGVADRILRGCRAHDNEHPWAYKTCEQVLDEEVEDPTAKRLLTTTVAVAPRLLH
jgi:hypothetical protein